MRVLLVVLLAAPPSVLPDRDAGQRLLDDGARLFDARDYAGALQKFEEAYRRFPSPRLLFNIGETNRRLSRSDEARRAFERFLLEAGPDVPEDLRHAAERALRDLDGPPAPPPPARPPPLPEPATAAEATGSSQEPTMVATKPAPPPPLYRRWPFWTAVGAAVAGGVIAGVLIDRGEDLPAADLRIDNRHP